MRRGLAVYTVLYPAARSFLLPWYRSVLAQTDRAFDLWITLDGISPDELHSILPVGHGATIHSAPANSTPAQLRNEGLREIAEHYTGVVLVDCDDVLYPDRVASARRSLETSDLSGCALELMDVAGVRSGIVFGPGSDDVNLEFLTKWNVFGLSNSAYRCDLIRNCLPIPGECVLIDWLLAIRATALGARLRFDHQARMGYRRYGGNTAPLSPPFTTASVLRATALVMGHYELLLSGDWTWPDEVGGILDRSFRRISTFSNAISTSSDLLQRYTEALNQLSPRAVWWWCVANPHLEGLWSPSALASESSDADIRRTSSPRSALTTTATGNSAAN